MTLLAGKVALVTGGGSGLGAAAALSYVREGAAVAVADRNEGNARAVAEQITSAGGKTIAIVVDVSSEAQVASMVAQVIAEFGRLDCCFNSAGIGTKEVDTLGIPLSKVTADAWNKTIAINLTGVWLSMKHELAAMGPGGAIVNVASIAGLTGVPGAAAYVASKHGVIGLTKSAAVEFSQHGVRVNVICPGYVETPLTAVTLRERGEQLLVRNPMSRFGTPAEIGDLAVWLSTDQASYLNGAVIAADGGHSVV